MPGLISNFIIYLSLCGCLITGSFATEEDIIPLNTYPLDQTQDQFRLRRTILDKREALLLFKEKAKVPFLTFQAELVTQRFILAVLLKFDGKDILLTKWNKGAHGEEVLLFDLNSSKATPVYRYASAWPLTFEANAQKLTIHGKGELDSKSGEPVEQTKIWPTP